jgi:glycosyltransferase involved in cell wall biosynthesis
MNSDILVTFLFTSYNFEQYVADAIYSILNQTGNYPIEIIIFDDCSTDNSANIIAGIKDERITFIHNKTNLGAFMCINKGFKMAKGKYICRFDGDDKWLPNFLETVIPIMETNKDVGLLFGNYIPMDSKHNTFEVHKIDRPAYLETKDNDFKEILKKYYINAPSVIFRKEALNASFPIPSHFGNFIDYYLSLNVLKNWKSYYLREGLSCYRIHQGNNHRRAIRNKTDEKIIEILLTEFVDNNKNLTKKETKDIYSSNYRILGIKYFSENMEEDAKRCFKKALKYDKKYLFDAEFIRLFTAVNIGIGNYEKIKKIIKK